MAERLLIGLLTEGHILLEGLPGLAKTTAVRALADAVHLQFKRIQFTPDLLPSDIVGTQIYNNAKGDFEVKKGPIFANLILADEINRAPSKVQTALLEAMQERQVTLGDETFPLPRPFLVLATQNPLEQEGTYSLPEAQMDRFLFKVKVGYPSIDEEKRILDAVSGSGLPQTRAVVDQKMLEEGIECVKSIYLDERIKDYIVNLVQATRYPAQVGLESLVGMIEVGASPRASIDLARAAKAHAFIKGRAFVTPEDVKAIAPEVLRHRISLSFEAEADQVSAEQVLQSIFDGVSVP
jgi:MoxR-like ATPase